MAYTVTLQMDDGKVRRLRVDAEQTILDAALSAGVALPNLCCQGWCLTCAAKLVKGKVHHPEARRYFEADYQAGFILPCSAKPLSDCVLKTHQKSAMVGYRIDHSLPAPRG